MSRWRVYLWPLASCAPFIGLTWHQRWSLVVSMYSCSSFETRGMICPLPLFPRHWDAMWGVKMKSRQWIDVEIQLKLLHFVDSQWAQSRLLRTREQAVPFSCLTSGYSLMAFIWPIVVYTQTNEPKNKNKRDRKLPPVFSQVSLHVVIIRLMRFVCSCIHGHRVQFLSKKLIYEIAVRLKLIFRGKMSPPFDLRRKDMLFLKVNTIHVIFLLKVNSMSIFISLLWKFVLENPVQRWRMCYCCTSHLTGNEIRIR